MRFLTVPSIQPRTFVVILFTSLVSGCAPKYDGLRIAIEPKSVQLHQSDEAVWFTLKAQILNRSRHAVFVSECGPELQRIVDGKWIAIWTPICLTTPPVRVAPGDSMTILVNPTGHFRSNFEPRWNPLMTEGEYRLIFPFMSSDAPGATLDVPIKYRSSQSFQVSKNRVEH